MIGRAADVAPEAKADIASHADHPIPACRSVAVTFPSELDSLFHVIEYRSLLLHYPARCPD